MTKGPVFVDSNIWLAFVAKNDQYHIDADSYLKKVSGKVPLFTSNLVVHETVMLLYRRVSKAAAIQFLNTVYSDKNVAVLFVSENLEREAYDIFVKYRDQGFSIVDCTSFALMKERQIERAATFDHHFKAMRFTIEP